MQRLALLGMLWIVGTVNAEMKAESGIIPFTPTTLEPKLPESFRLEKHDYRFELTPKRDLPISGVEIYDLKFPSPVQSPYESNNTVYAEYFRPKGEGPFPAVIVLEILSGGEELCRGIGMFLAQNKIAALYVRMAYYGPRRPKTERVRLLSPDIPHTVAAVRQTVLDCRVATVWLTTRPEINKERLGIVGTSLGSFLSAITAAMEPRLKKAALLLGGGSFVDVYYDDPRAAPFRQINELLGGSKARLKELIAPIDPITYAELLGQRDVLIIAAQRDDIVPPKAAELLWQATGKQKIVWIDTDHYGAALYLLPMMRHVLDHFRNP